MTTIHFIVLAIAVVIAIYPYTRNMADLEMACPAERYSTLEKFSGSHFTDGISNFSLKDGDRCCGTTLSTTVYKGWKKDVHGDLYRIIVLFERGRNDTTRFQHVTEGKCSPKSMCTKTNTPCRQKYVFQPLLAKKKEGKPAFHQFNVPAYCFCPNTD